MEWAKWKQVDDPASKLVLLVIADHAEGPDSTCVLREGDFENEADIDRKDVHVLIGRMQDAGILKSTLIPRSPADPSDSRSAGMCRRLHEQWGDSIKFELNISNQWRPGARTPKPKTDGRRDPDCPTAVYRLYDATGELLYVGIAKDPGVRFEQHKYRMAWWNRVVTREITWYETRPLAEAEEYRAIKQDGPLFNVHHALGPEGPDRSKRQTYATHDASPAAFGAALRRLRAELLAGVYDIIPLPPNEILARAYGIPPSSVWHLHFRLKDEGLIAHLADDVDGRWIWHRPWSEW